MKSDNSASARTPNDILHKPIKSAKRHPQKPSAATSKLKNLILNKSEADKLMIACGQNDVEAVKQLLETTCPPLNLDLIRDSRLRSPLLVACAAGNAAIVRLLIEHGASVNNPVGDIIGNLPLDLAVVSNNVETILTLLDAGAYIYPPLQPVNGNGKSIIPTRHRAVKRTPLQLAQSRLNLLLQQSPCRNNSARYPEFVSQVLKVIRILKYYMHSASSGHDTNPLDALETLTTKLSAVHIEEKQDDATMEELWRIVKDLNLNSERPP
ncbi:ankyrin [Hesseltinella vesiculosa]|uniref:Ankyrin n=1 Tax=Hesseltinella vesiculosa TaxID=101127 RepID=A0A1X2GTG8_9FUNG|nr:ankyrin [Hesseltinella vesiculosa]